MTLSEMYATLTEKKPSLAVSMTDDDGAVWRLTGIDPKMKTWAEESDIGKAYLGEKSAAALIRVRWEDALPDCHGLARSTDGYYFIARYGCEHQITDARKDPIEMLYHFHMEQA